MTRTGAAGAAIVVAVGVGVAIGACSRAGSGTSSAGASAGCTGGAGYARGRLQVPGLYPESCISTEATRFGGVVDRPSPSILPLVNGISWTWTTPTPVAPVNATPALVNPGYPASSASEVLYIGTNTSRGTNFYALSNLTSTPTVAWDFAAAGAFDGSWVTLDGTNQIYAEDTTGTLYCFGVSTGPAPTTCTGWGGHQSATVASGDHGSSLTSPWWDAGTNAIFFADGAGILHKVSVATGTETWALDLSAVVGQKFAVRGSPVVYNGQIYLGDDGGAFMQITDPGATAPTTYVKDWLCGGSPPAGCGADWAVLGASTIDVTKGFVYVAANGQVFEYPITSTPTATHDHAVSLGAGGYGVYSTPILDTTNLYLYVGYNNRLHKIPYPFTATTADLSTPLPGTGADPSYPRSSALPFNGEVYIGDGAGYVDRFACIGGGSAAFSPGLTASSPQVGTSVDSTAVIDFSSSGGNIEIGFTSGSTTPGPSGGVVEVAQSGAWTCPNGHGTTCTVSCGDTQPDGGAVTTSICMPVGGCCTASDCLSGMTCTNNQCACPSGGKLCGGTCYAAGTCCTNADCSGGKVCSGPGGSCVTPTTTVSIPVAYQKGAGVTSLQGSVYTPTNAYAGSVTFTNNSTSVTGGTAFKSQFVNGQSISADGVSYYVVASVVSNTTITLATAFAAGTETVTTYYEADCVANQACPQTVAITGGTGLSDATCTTASPAALGTTTTSLCTKTVTATLPTPGASGAAYAVTLKAVDTNGNTQAASVTGNKFLLASGASSATLPTVNLPRVFPIGSGSNAACPLNVAIDDSNPADVWTTNGNGLSGSTCSAPTNNLSELKASAPGIYAPSVYNPAGMTASPEFISGDASGNVWVTVPSLASGIFKITSAGATASGFPVAGTCVTPRGIVADPGQSPNGAFVACYGTTSGGAISKLSATGTQTAYTALNDASHAQPVSVALGRSYYAPGAPPVETYANYDIDCNEWLYVNRSGTSSLVFSSLSTALASLSTQTYEAVDYNPYSLSIDGAGTAYTVARTNGHLINFGYQCTRNGVFGCQTYGVTEYSDRAVTTNKPWGLAIDDNYTNTFVLSSGATCGGATTVNYSNGNIYASNANTNTVSRYNNDPQDHMNDFVVGSTSSPMPQGLAYDWTTEFVWVANGAEATLSRFYRDLFVFANDEGNGEPSPKSGIKCATASGGAITVTGKGFDTNSAAYNTVLVAGYLATVTAVNAGGATYQPDRLTVTVPTGAPVTGPITVTNQNGSVVSLCTYTL